MPPVISVPPHSLREGLQARLLPQPWKGLTLHPTSPPPSPRPPPIPAQVEAIPFPHLTAVRTSFPVSKFLNCSKETVLGNSGGKKSEPIRKMQTLKNKAFKEHRFFFALRLNTVFDVWPDSHRHRGLRPYQLGAWSSYSDYSWETGLHSAGPRHSPSAALQGLPPSSRL